MKDNLKRWIIWSRRELRLTYNPALSAVVAEADLVIPLFIYDPASKHAWSPGAAGRWWLHQSLSAPDSGIEDLTNALISPIFAENLPALPPPW